MLLLTASILPGARFGMGDHVVKVKQMGPQALQRIRKMQYAIEITWSICTYMVKLSTLLLFGRIFHQPSARFRCCLYTTHVFLALWTWGSFFSAIFRCIPVQSFWSPTIPGKCPHAMVGRVVTASLNSATDFILLALPMPLVWGLQMTVKQKIGVLCIFGVGIL